MKKIFCLLVVAAGFAACKKSSSSTPVTPTTVDTSQYGTPYANVPDAKDIVMYEVNIRAFSGTDNFTGVINRLDSIKALGVNVIWLMPTYPVGVLKSINSPYCVKDYQAVNSEFGSLTDLRNLVSQAHSKGMAVILDWVADHTSWDNAWITNKDWYQQDASGNIVQPAGTTWTDVAGLNYANTSMRAAMITNMNYWIKVANIDGYRCDDADAVPDDFWTSAITSIKGLNHKLILLAEGSRTANFTAGFQMNYSWNYYGQLKSVFGSGAAASTLTTINSTDNAGVPSGDFMLRFITNHDLTISDGTPISLYKSKTGAVAAFVLTTYMGGVPLIYDGQEVGCPVQLPIFSTSTIDWTINADMTTQYKAILAARSTSDAVKEGPITSYSDNNVAVFKRTSITDTVLTLVNVRSVAETYTVNAAIANTTWRDAMNSDASVTVGTTLTVQPFGYMILRK